MNIFDPLVTVRLVVALGIVNLVTAALVFFSCRCLPGSWLGKRLTKYHGYQRFYKYHCYVWSLLAFSHSTRQSGADILWLAKIDLE